MEREVNAVFSAGLLRELKCDMVEAYLQPSLNYKGRISDRPLYLHQHACFDESTFSMTSFTKPHEQTIRHDASSKCQSEEATNTVKCW